MKSKRCVFCDDCKEKLLKITAPYYTISAENLNCFLGIDKHIRKEKRPKAIKYLIERKIIKPKSNFWHTFEVLDN